MRKRRKIQNKLLFHEDQRLITKLENQLLEVEAKLKASHETQRKHEENLAVSAIKANPKFLYTYAKKKLTTKSSIRSLEEDGNLIDKPWDITKTLSKHCSRVFSTPLEEKRIHSPGTFFNTHAAR